MKWQPFFNFFIMADAGIPFPSKLGKLETQIFFLEGGVGNWKFVHIYRLLLPPANEVCEGYVFRSVCLSTGGGGGCLRPGVASLSGITPYGNKWAVRILLECILVAFILYKKPQLKLKQPARYTGSCLRRVKWCKRNCSL